jgi:hypothetical protein
VSENDVESEETEPGMCREAGVTVSHEVLHPLMEFDLAVPAEGDVGQAEGEKGGERHREQAKGRVFRQGWTSWGPGERRVTG